MKLLYCHAWTPTPLFAGSARGVLALATRRGAEREHLPALPSGLTALNALNGATKWLVVAAQTLAVATEVARGTSFVAAYIVIGSILAAFGTGALKKLLAIPRPEAAFLTDPGMPSSHAVTATFAAAAWASHLGPSHAAAGGWLLAAAALISLLRVACGLHTFAQVGVGAALGGASAVVYMAALPALSAWPAAGPLVYAAYLGGSALFITRKMAAWTARA